MRSFPRVTDALQDPGAGYLPLRAREIYRKATAELFEEGTDRLTPSTWFARYCAVRCIRMRDVKPLARDVHEAGLLLAQAVQYGWVEEAPGPRDGQGWRLTPAGRKPLLGRPAKRRRTNPVQLAFPAQT
jgi:hypothetical protein